MPDAFSAVSQPLKLNVGLNSTIESAVNSRTVSAIPRYIGIRLYTGASAPMRSIALRPGRDMPSIGRKIVISTRNAKTEASDSGQQAALREHGLSARGVSSPDGDDRWRRRAHDLPGDPFAGRGNARSPFRITEQPTGREVDWISRFLDCECVRRVAKNTPGSHAKDLLRFLRWWASVNDNEAIAECNPTVDVVAARLMSASSGHLSFPHSGRFFGKSECYISTGNGNGWDHCPARVPVSAPHIDF